MIKLATFLAICALLAWPSSAEKRYDDYHLYKVIPETDIQVSYLRTLQEKYPFWSEVTHIGHKVLISVPPKEVDIFLSEIQGVGLSEELVVNDVQKLFEYELSGRTRSDVKALEWTAFHTLDEMYAWLDQLAQNNTNITTLVAGQTYEGRQIRGIRITNGANLPGVIIEAGIHAREWSTPSATSWIINEIINSPQNSTFRKFNYIYVPHLNPDGYVYTWTDDRLWRKTRRPYNTCVGADPNRNFDDHFNGEGTSTNPCSETYAGPSPFSEVETRTYSEFLRNLTTPYDLYIAFHSSAQLLIYPWGWTPQPAPLHDYWQRIGEASSRAIAAVNGNVFVVGDIYNTIYPAASTSMDWYYGVFNNTIAYTYEMMSEYGFVLPPELIIPSGKEHLAGLQVVFEEYLKSV